MSAPFKGLGVLFAALLSACTSQDGRAEVNEKRANAVVAIQEYAYAQKADFIKQMNQELAEIQVELDRLSAKVESSTGEAKADAQAKLVVVHDRWLQTKAQLDLVSAANESTWDEMKSSFQKSNDELHSSLTDARQWLSDKIAP